MIIGHAMPFPMPLSGPNPSEKPFGNWFVSKLTQITIDFIVKKFGVKVF